MCFEKQVNSSVFGDPPGTLEYVALRVVPMGWSASVGAIQSFIRFFVYGACGVNPAQEMSPQAPFLEGDVAVTCMDGFDKISRVLSFVRPKGSKHPEMTKFLELSRRIGLPVNAVKSVCQALNATDLGGEIDGILGVLRHNRLKSHALVCKTGV